MTRGWKIGLSILAGVFLLLVLAGGGCLYVLSRYGREIGEGAKKSQTDGETLGKGSDDMGCLKEALARKKKVGSVTEVDSVTGLVSITVFLDKCLQNSKPTPAFCENVPVLADIDSSETWRAKKCAEAGQGDWYCKAIFRLVQAHCEGLDKPDSEKPKSN